MPKELLLYEYHTINFLSCLVINGLITFNRCSRMIAVII
jgi:hypothetical protein